MANEEHHDLWHTVQMETVCLLITGSYLVDWSNNCRLFLGMKKDAFVVGTFIVKGEVFRLAQ